MVDKRSLGKGLAALLSEQMDGSEIKQIPLEQITPNPNQPRLSFNDDSLLELSESIRQYGVLQPVIVRRTGNERFELIAGERRFRASKKAGLTEIPAIVRTADLQLMLELALIENVQREDINPVDSARAYKKLMDDFNMTHEQIAEKIGKSRVTVSNTLRLLQLTEPALELLERGTISEGHGRALLALTDPVEQKNMLAQIVAGGISVRETERRIRESLLIKESKPRMRPKEITYTPTEAELKDIARRLAELFGTKVQILPGATSGKILIEYYSDEELGRILELMGIM